MALMTGIMSLEWVIWINAMDGLLQLQNSSRNLLLCLYALSGSSKTVINTDGDTVGMIGFSYFVVLSW